MKLKIVGVLFLVVIVAMTAFYLINRPRLGSVVYPSPNGYDAVTAAGKEMTPLPLDFDTTQDVEALKEYLSENADQAAMLDQAAGQDYLIRLSEMQTLQQTMELSGTVRNASRLLYTDARLAELEGRTVDAADSLTKMAILGRRSSRGGLAVNQLVAIAVERQALEGLTQLSSKLSADEKSRIVNQIQKEDAGEPSIDQLVDDIVVREREMTKREHGTFAGSFMLWQLSDTEFVQQQYDDLRKTIEEMVKIRQESIELLGQTESTE